MTHTLFRTTTLLYGYSFSDHTLLVNHIDKDLAVTTLKVKDFTDCYNLHYVHKDIFYTLHYA